MTYRFTVEYSVDHRAMERGEYRTAFVAVEAEDRTTADLLAAQIVGATTGGIPTATQEVRS